MLRRTDSVACPLQPRILRVTILTQRRVPNHTCGRGGMKALIKEFRRRCLEANEAYVAMLFTVGGAVLGAAGLVRGLAQVCFIAGGVFVLLLTGVAVYFRERAKSRERSEAKEVADAAALARYRLLDEHLSPLLQLLAETAGVRDHAKRKEYAAKVRLGVVFTAAAIVAPAVASGTRANLFVRSGNARNGSTMRLEPGCFAGRGDKSQRVFTARSETMTAILKNQYRLVNNVEDENLKYKSYLTVPVASDDDSVFGALTADCPSATDLSKDDIPAMNVLASIAAAAYECERVLPQAQAQ